MNNLPSVKFSDKSQDGEIASIIEDHIKDVEGTVFNPSFARMGLVEAVMFNNMGKGPEGKYLRSYLSIKDGSKHSLVDIGELYKGVLDGFIIDARLFKMSGKIFFVFNNGSKINNDMFISEAYPITSIKPKKLHYQDRLPVEKNWSLYSEGDDVYALYSLSPLVVLKREKIENGNWVFKDHYREKGDHNKLISIGTPLSRHTGKYYFYLHEKHKASQRKMVYLGRVACFDHNKRSISVHKDSWSHSLASLTGEGKNKLGPCMSCSYYAGMEIKDSKVAASYGINDSYYGVSGHDISYLDDSNFDPLSKGSAVIETDTVDLSVSAKARNAAMAISAAALSVAKTSIFKKKALSVESIKERLKVCSNCPGNHAVWKAGSVHTCGKLIESITGQAETCGCLLKKKARDSKQDCPMGYWPKEKE